MVDLRNCKTNSQMDGEMTYDLSVQSPHSLSFDDRIQYAFVRVQDPNVCMHNECVARLPNLIF